MAKQRGLGKGLSVLIPVGALENEAPSNENNSEKTSVNFVSCDLLSPNPYQPRRNIYNEQLEDLSASIKEHGVIQPILVRRVKSNYQIVAGERRWKAAQLAGLSEVPVREMELSDSQVMELALVENLQREDLSTIEIAQGIADLISHLSLTHDEVAKKIGMSRTAVTNKLRLLQLPPEVLSMLDSNEITEGHARALLSLPSSDKIIEFANLVSKNGLNVRQLEDMIRRMAITSKLEAAFPQKPLPPIEFEEEIALLNTNYNLNIKIAGSKKNLGLVIKGLKKWQVQLLLEYIEEHNEELFPRE
ncbi:MAG: ParB/RepB/Spo0J family partition protein [Synergistaceae bacterium]|jgi:ParB family chromosome partitioning protein|nr:ParB/RepB/Spo0J family partition protein [Synergistaceae bacterium]